MACHNRRAKTIASLEALSSSATAVPDLTLHFFVADDGSTDGTSAAVRALGGPVDVIHGDGSLFWTRGMSLAWRTAATSGREFDAYLLLNDDTVVDHDALIKLLEVLNASGQDSIVVGAIRDPNGGAITYGGVVQTARWHPGKMRRLGVKDEAQEADTFNANCVLVPMTVYAKLGTLDTAFTHAMSDYDYGLRARAAGFKVIVAPTTVGTCARNSRAGTWEDETLPLKQRLVLLESTKGLPRREWSHYLRRHGPWFWQILVLGPTLRTVVSAARVRVFGTSSKRAAA